VKEKSSSSVREIAGMVVAGLGVALVPVGWYSSRLLWLASGLLIVIGVLMLVTERVAAAEKEVENRPEINPAPVKQSVPADIHNYSGWRDGGQSLGGDGGGDGD
jgi:cytochrome c-type biogenesis protein CcmH/NrfF